MSEIETQNAIAIARNSESGYQKLADIYLPEDKLLILVERDKNGNIGISACKLERVCDHAPDFPKKEALLNFKGVSDKVYIDPKSCKFIS